MPGEVEALLHPDFSEFGTSGRRALRSSIWRRTPDGWRVHFHQGPLIPES